VSGALANLALSKRSEILDKSSVNETLKDSLMKSPLTDKMRIDLTSLPQGWKEEVVPFLLEQSITYEGATT
jgi:hypothetical protein